MKNVFSHRNGSSELKILMYSSYLNWLIFDPKQNGKTKQTNKENRYCLSKLYSPCSVNIDSYPFLNYPLLLARTKNEMNL